MSVLQRNLDLFEDSSELASIKQDFILLYTSTEKVRRGCFAKNDSTRKELLKLIDTINERLDRIERVLDIKDEVCFVDDETPLLQLIN